MAARVREGRAAASALIAVVFLMFFTNHPAGSGAIDNDVIIDWENFGGSARVTIVGGPHLVRDVNSVTIVVNLFGGAAAPGAPTGQLQAAIYPLDLCSASHSTDCPVRAQIDIDGRRTIPLAEFTNAHLQLGVQSLPTPGILVISGRIHTAQFTQAQITISGDASPVVIDRAGDVGSDPQSRASDVPARSIEIVRALNQVETGLFPIRPVDLDTTVPRNANAAVGYTHLFDFPLDASNEPIGPIQSAILTLRLTNPNGLFQNDFIMLDPGVRELVNGRTPIAVVPLPPLVRCPVPDHDGSFDFMIDLKSVPTNLLSGGHLSPGPPGGVDLRPDLRDRRLNVMLVGDSTVDFSDLLVVFHDSPGSGSVEPKCSARN